MLITTVIIMIVKDDNNHDDHNSNYIVAIIMILTILLAHSKYYCKYRMRIPKMRRNEKKRKIEKEKSFLSILATGHFSILSNFQYLKQYSLKNVNFLCIFKFI